MKIKEGFILRTICGEHVVVGEGLAQVNFNKLLSMNESAAWLWEQLKEREFTVEDMADLLQEKYEVTADVALRDSRALADKWLENGVISQ